MSSLQSYYDDVATNASSTGTSRSSLHRKDQNRTALEVVKEIVNTEHKKRPREIDHNDDDVDDSDGLIKRRDLPMMLMDISNTSNAITNIDVPTQLLVSSSTCDSTSHNNNDETTTTIAECCGTSIATTTTSTASTDTSRCVSHLEPEIMEHGGGGCCSCVISTAQQQQQQEEEGIMKEHTVAAAAAATVAAAAADENHQNNENNNIDGPTLRRTRSTLFAPSIRQYLNQTTCYNYNGQHHGNSNDDNNNNNNNNDSNGSRSCTLKFVPRPEWCGPLVEAIMLSELAFLQLPSPSHGSSDPPFYSSTNHYIDWEKAIIMETDDYDNHLEKCVGKYYIPDYIYKNRKDDLDVDDDDDALVLSISTNDLPMTKTNDMNINNYYYRTVDDQVYRSHFHHHTSSSSIRSVIGPIQTEAIVHYGDIDLNLTVDGDTFDYDYDNKDHIAEEKDPNKEQLIKDVATGDHEEDDHNNNNNNNNNNMLNKDNHSEDGHSGQEKYDGDDPPNAATAADDDDRRRGHRKNDDRHKDDNHSGNDNHGTDIDSVDDEDNDDDGVDDDTSNDSAIVFYNHLRCQEEKSNFVRRQLKSNVIYFDAKENIWKSQPAPPPRYRKMTSERVDMNTNDAAISLSQHCTSAKITYQELIRRRRYTKNTMGWNNNTILLMAIQENATDVAMDIIRIEYDTLHYHLAHHANCFDGSIRESTLLEMANTIGLTPLILAAQKGNIQIVQELLRCGVSMSYTPLNNYTGSAIMQAAHFGQTEVIECFIQYYYRQNDPAESLVEVLDKSNVNKTTPLMRAAQEGHLSVVELLLEHDASVNCQNNKNGMTPLMFAAQRGHAAICEVLIDYGAKFNKPTKKNNSSALMLACGRGHLDVVKVLVAAGCELHLRNNEFNTARQIVQDRMERRQEALEEQVNQRHDRHDRNGVAPDGTNDIDSISNRVDEKILLLVNVQTQIQLIQFSWRVERNFEIIGIYALFHQNRANIKLKDGTIVDVNSAVQWLTTVKGKDKNSNSTISPSFIEQPQVSQTEAQHDFTSPCTQMLIRLMMLPGPLAKTISLFLPLQHLWERRIEQLQDNVILHIDHGVKIVHALDIIDEILEEGGFLSACDQARIPAPIPNSTWCDWKRQARARAKWSDYDEDSSFHFATPPEEVDVTESLPPSPQDEHNPTIRELRRLVGYTSLLAQYQSQTDIVAILMAEPYHMPQPLINKLIRIADISSICRRCCAEQCLPTSLNPYGCHDVSFSPKAAENIVHLARAVYRWYNRQNN